MSSSTIGGIFNKLNKRDGMNFFDFIASIQKSAPESSAMLAKTRPGKKYIPQSLFLTVSIGSSKSASPIVSMLTRLKIVRLSCLELVSNSFDNIVKNTVEDIINKNPKKSDGGYSVLQKYKSQEVKFCLKSPSPSLIFRKVPLAHSPSA